jgi:CrcB protein
MRTTLIVAIGGAVGAATRWTVGELVTTRAGAFPTATFAVNVVGCLAIGLANRWIARGSTWWFAVCVGVLGGLTTFSAFAVETRTLLAAGRTGTASAYVAATMLLGVGATEIARGRRTSS